MKLFSLFTKVCLVLTFIIGTTCYAAMQPTGLLAPTKGNGQLSKEDARFEKLLAQIMSDDDDAEDENSDDDMGVDLDEKKESATQNRAQSVQEVKISQETLEHMGLDYKSAKQAKQADTTTERYQPYVCPDPQCNKAHFSADGLLYHILSIHCTLVAKSTDDPGCVIDGSFSCNYCNSNVNRYTCWFHLANDCPFHTTNNTEMSHE